MRNRLNGAGRNGSGLPLTPETNSDHDGGKYIAAPFCVKVFARFHSNELITNSYQTDKNI
jgi:hypothetical protein